MENNIFAALTTQDGNTWKYSHIIPATAGNPPRLIYTGQDGATLGFYADELEQLFSSGYFIK